MNGVASHPREARSGSGAGPRDPLPAREALALHDRLAQAVPTREEGVVLAHHLGETHQRRAVVMARSDGGWRVIGACDVDCAIDAEVTGDPLDWLQALAPGDWRATDLCHGRRVVGRALLEGDPVGVREACRIAAPFFAARRSRAEGAQAQLGLHISQISHDMRQPLSVITLSVDLLDDFPEARPVIDRIRRARRDLVAFLEDLLAFTAAPSPPRRELALGPLIEEIVDDFRERARALGLSLAFSASAQPFVIGDARRLGRAFGNLLSNAFEASPKGGTVKVELAADDEHALLSVSDDGPGVDPALREKIFEPFVTTRAAGTGLGLAVVRQVVRAHGGEVAFMDGDRSCVRVRLPRAHPIPR